ncbi:MAG TPA: RNA methyltransferase [Vicinamibacterales bacterium]|nr:RNA methyltransferase [Vicinamibacterales bacterium]
MIGIEAYRLVGDPAALERAGLFVAEGRLIVERLLLDLRFRVHSVAVTPPAAAALASVFAQRPDVAVHLCDPRELEALTGFDFHRGCLALAWRQPPAITLDSLAGARRVLALESVGNPDNVGGLFRTAFALGIDAVLIDRRTADPLYRKAIRTSMGATLRLPFLRLEAWADDLQTLRSRGFRVLALTPHPDAVPLPAVKVTDDDPLVIVVGSEGYGLTDGALAQSDLAVRIPIDPRADSLNVVVAAGIALSRLSVR